MSVNGTSLQNSALSFLQTATSRGQKQNAAALAGKAKPADAILAAIEKNDPEKAKALREERSEQQQLLQRLEASRKDINEERKAAARQKVAQLKAQIRALRALATLNPEQAARQAARLARELAAAVKDYAGAGGDTTLDIGTATAGADTADTVATEAGAVENVATATLKIPVEDNAVAVAQDPAQTDSDTDTDAVKGSVRETIQAQLGKASKQTARNREDDDFLRDARLLANELKAILKEIKEKLQTKSQDTADQDIATAEDALREVEEALQDISSGSAIGNVNILA